MALISEQYFRNKFFFTLNKNFKRENCPWHCVDTPFLFEVKFCNFASNKTNNYDN